MLASRQIIRLVSGVATAALALGACAAPAPAAPSFGPSATAASTPSATPSATAIPTVSLAPSASASANQVIPDGTYVSAPMQVAAMRAAINADTKLTAAAKSDLINNAFVLDDHKTSVVYMTFSAGQLTEGGSYDGGPRDVGARETYAFPDDHTLVTQDPCCVTTFQVTWSGKSFRLKRLSETTSLDAGSEAIATRLLFESTPFTLEP
jgi:hypothetical protein